MHLSDFNYALPEELIAEFPVEQRSASRLLCLDADSGCIQHEVFRDLGKFLNPGDLLVFNDTRVIPARLYAVKETGGKLEVLVERVLSDKQLLVQIRASKSPKPGSRLIFNSDSADTTDGEEAVAEVIGREDGFYHLQFPAHLDLMALLNKIGHIPLPPYIRRSDESIDSDRYQTVYARNAGAVAAPTAGLHFDEELLDQLRNNGIEFGFLTLHVGAGTFQPVRVDNIAEHKMHSELVDVSPELCQQVKACHTRGGKVVAVGTTSVRSLESAAKTGVLQPFKGETDIFIYPGYKFQVVDAMVTNFHLPESTLLMLVSAFCSKKMLLDAYREAIEQRYRFFSYGDAMFVYRSSTEAGK